MDDEITAEFIAETRQQLDDLAQILVDWPAAPADSQRIDTIFRFFHTVKGSAGFLDLPRFGALAHAAEDLLARLRETGAAATPAQMAAVLTMADHLAQLTDRLERGEGEGSEPALDARLIADLNGLPDEPPANAAPPAAQPEIMPDIGPEIAEDIAAAQDDNRTLRIPIRMMDRIMDTVSELVLARNELARRLRPLASDPAREGAFHRVSNTLADLREMISQSRMQRLERLFALAPRLVRDLQRSTGKRFDLVTSGGHVEIDRELIEALRDPLVHILRNAADHGLESPEERLARGKPAAGRIAISARQSGNHVVIRVADDGRGIDLDALRKRALARGVITPAIADSLTPQAMAELICMPGLSTAPAITELSGRGVGMDIVRARIQALGGQLNLENRPGQGLDVVLTMPMSLAIMPCLTIAAGATRFALPRDSIEEILASHNQALMLSPLGDGQVLRHRGRIMPYVALADVLAGDGQAADPVIAPVIVILSRGGGNVFALGVSAMHDHEELVLRPVSPLIADSGLYSGTALPDSGEPILLIDVGGLAARASLPDSQIDASHTDAQGDTGHANAPRYLLAANAAGRWQAFAAMAVQHIDMIDPACIDHKGAMPMVVRGSDAVPLLGHIPAAGEPAFPALLLNDGGTRLFHGVAELGDMVALGAGMQPVSDTPLVLARQVLDGRIVDIMDLHALFALAGQTGPVQAAQGRTACLIIDDASQWARAFLAPMLVQAGYEPRFAEDDPDPADANIILQCANSAIAPAQDAHVIRLTDQPSASGPGAIWRYDRSAILAALAQIPSPRKSA